MKKSLLMILVASTALFSCNQEKMSQLEEQNRQLAEDRSRQDSLLNDFLGAFNDIENNLSTIKEKENLIALSAGDNELKSDQKDRIVQDIQSINELLDQNKTKIAELEKKLKGSNWRVREFKTMVSRLKTQVAEKDTAIMVLKENLATKDFAINTLNTKIDSMTMETVSQNARLVSQTEQLEAQAELIATQTETLNSAYYVVGTAKELAEKNIIQKGGLFGKPNVNSEMAQSAFTKIDLTETFSIPVNGKKARVITKHPEGTYVFNDQDKSVEALEITNPDKFWETSRYLVVVLN